MYSHAAFMEGFKSACLRLGVNPDSLIKQAFDLPTTRSRHQATGEEPEEPQRIPAQAFANATVGGSVPQIPMENNSAMQLLKALNSVGMYGKPLKPREPFSGY